MEQLILEMQRSKHAQGKVSHVKKRDGRVVEFNISRIARAVHKAFEACHEGSEDQAWQCAGYVLNRLENPTVDIEHIQDMVEDTLMNMGYRASAKAYILYRAKRSEARTMENALQESLNMMDEYLQLQDWRVNENSNMSYSLQGLNSHISSSLTANYWLTRIYTPEIGEAHRKGEFHIHDLGLLSAYCVGWDLEQLLIRGFGGVSGKIASAPPKHLGTALGQIVNFFYTMQGEAAGAQAFANFDTLLAPFIAYDGLSYLQVKQLMQEFVYNLNVPTRVGFQTPFTNLTFDLVVPSYLQDKAVIIGGELQDRSYGEFTKEATLINRAFADIMLEGDAHKRPFTFPIPTYNITKDFDWTNPDYDALWEMTAKYGTPYFSNFINSDMSEEDARSMCCRLRLDNREVKQQMSDNALAGHTDSGVKRGGLFSANPMTGSIGVVTINLPRIAYQSEDEHDFMHRLSLVMEKARSSLELKRKVVEELTEKGLYPFTSVYLEDIKKRTGKYWTNHFSTIGMLGMNEAVMNLLHIDYSQAPAKEFAERVLDFMLARLEMFKQETGNLYNLEASPAEGASYRLAKNDRKTFPDIHCSGSDEVPFYTNSVHLPVDHTDDIFDLLDHQDSLQSRFTGGTVIHVFLGQKNIPPRSISTLVRTIASQYRLPYFSITPTFSICPVHGYIAGEHHHCPLPHTEAELEKHGIYKELTLNNLESSHE